MHLLTYATIRRLREHPEWGLMAALRDARVPTLATGRLLMSALESVLPSDEWYNTKGDDAIAALQLADP